MIFYGPACYETARNGFDLGAADTFYSHQEAYTMAWSDALLHVTCRLVVTLASKGADKMVMYRVDSYTKGAWIIGEPKHSTQRDFWTDNQFHFI